MASPFPGVDPYLESQGRWPDFHGSIITYCRDALNDRLPPGYVAQIDERIHLIEAPDAVRSLLRPDVAIERRDAPRTVPQGPAVALEMEPVTIPLLLEEEVRETRVEILHLPDRELIAVLEVLSPSNKEEPGFSQYRGKRSDILGPPIHLIELDFLIGGHRIPLRRPLPPGDFYALVARGNRRPDCAVYSWTVRQPLPTIPIPLKAPDPDLRLDLADLFAKAYERGRYALLIDYRRDLPLPLAPEDRSWAEELARGAAR